MPRPAPTRGAGGVDPGRQRVGEHRRVEFPGLAVGVAEGAREGGGEQRRAMSGPGGEQLVDEAVLAAPQAARVEPRRRRGNRPGSRARNAARQAPAGMVGPIGRSIRQGAADRPARDTGRSSGYWSGWSIAGHQAAERARALPAPAAASARASTRAPSASCAGSAYSAGLWLIPPRQGTNSIPVGQTGTTNCASWKAPEGIRMAPSPSAVRRRAARHRPRAGRSATGRAWKRLLDAHLGVRAPPPAPRPRSRRRAPRSTAASGWRKSMLKLARSATLFEVLGATVIRPTVKRSTSAGIGHQRVQRRDRAHHVLHRVAPQAERRGAGMRGLAAQRHGEPAAALDAGDDADRPCLPPPEADPARYALRDRRAGGRRGRGAACRPPRPDARRARRRSATPSGSRTSAKSASGVWPDHAMLPMQPGAKRPPSSLVQATTSIGRRGAMPASCSAASASSPASTP